MPIKWEPGKNPYVFNYFGKLEVGPNTQPLQVSHHKNSRIQELAFEPGSLKLAGVELDEHAISEACTKICDPKFLAEELLLAHPQTQREARKLKTLLEDLRRLAVVEEDAQPIPLYHPLAIFWFIPAPGVEAAEAPQWSDFGFVEPGDPRDLELDIVFDW